MSLLADTDDTRSAHDSSSQWQNNICKRVELSKAFFLIKKTSGQGWNLNSTTPQMTLKKMASQLSGSNLFTITEIWSTTQVGQIKLNSWMHSLRLTYSGAAPKHKTSSSPTYGTWSPNQLHCVRHTKPFAVSCAQLRAIAKSVCKWAWSSQIPHICNTSPLNPPKEEDRLQALKELAAIMSNRVNLPTKFCRSMHNIQTMPDERWSEPVSEPRP